MTLVPAARTALLNQTLWFEIRLRPDRIAATQVSLDRFAPAGAVLLVGDSLIAQLPPHFVDRHALNYGVGAIRVEHVRVQLRRFHSLPQAAALVLLAGTNDLVDSPRAAEQAIEGMRTLLAELPPRLPVLLVEVPPIDPAAHSDRTLEAIAALNRGYRAIAASRAATTFVPTHAALADAQGRLRPEFHQGDGLHLSPAGNRQFAACLRAALADLPPTPPR